MHNLLDGQVKAFLVGGDLVRDIPLYQKILAALLTGECSFSVPLCCKIVRT